MGRNLHDKNWPQKALYRQRGVEGEQGGLQWDDYDHDLSTVFEKCSINIDLQRA